jgi:hypothetical protein
MISYVLYVFLYSVQGHAILLIENNPFPTPEACKMVRDTINEHKVTKIGPYEFRVTPPRKPERILGVNRHE